jgi:uncharacterized membrane protein YoaK (UPF0700 family)
VSSDIHPPDKWLSFGLAFVGGYGDAAGFVLAKTFTGHVTGSLVLGAISVVAHDWRGGVAHFSAVACFLAGIPLSVLIARMSVRWAPRPPLTTALGIEVLLIVAAYVASASRAAPAVEILVICLSLALGLQNGAFRRTGGISVHTTYLTGTITGLLAAQAENVAFRVARPSTAPDPTFGFLFGIWGVFIVGAATGAAMVVYFKELGILGAALVLLAIIVRHSIAASREHPAT